MRGEEENQATAGERNAATRGGESRNSSICYCPLFTPLLGLATHFAIQNGNFRPS